MIVCYQSYVLNQSCKRFVVLLNNYYYCCGKERRTLFTHPLFRFCLSRWLNCHQISSIKYYLFYIKVLIKDISTLVYGLSCLSYKKTPRPSPTRLSWVIISASFLFASTCSLRNSPSMKSHICGSLAASATAWSLSNFSCTSFSNARASSIASNAVVHSVFAGAAIDFH